MSMRTHRGKTFKDLVLEAKGVIQEVDRETLKTWLADSGKSVVVLDVREPADYAHQHIPGAIHLSRGLLELDIDEVVPNQDQLIVTYCGGGSRSALAAQTLQIMGYNQVYSLQGGLRYWLEGVES